jgi:hypothetical protein
MPCITDSDEFRFPAEAIEEESPLTDMEKRISWLCSEWADANEIDTFDEWNSVRLMIAGALQALIYTVGRHEDYKALDAARDMAFENSLDCIKRNRYEGAAA